MRACSASSQHRPFVLKVDCIYQGFLARLVARCGRNLLRPDDQLKNYAAHAAPGEVHDLGERGHYVLDRIVAGGPELIDPAEQRLGFQDDRENPIGLALFVFIPGTGFRVAWDFVKGHGLFVDAHGGDAVALTVAAMRGIGRKEALEVQVRIVKRQEHFDLSRLLAREVWVFQEIIVGPALHGGYNEVIEFLRRLELIALRTFTHRTLDPDLDMSQLLEPWREDLDHIQIAPAKFWFFVGHLFPLFVIRFKNLLRNILQGIAIPLDGFQADGLGLLRDILQGIAISLDGLQADGLGLLRNILQGIAISLDGLQADGLGLLRDISQGIAIPLDGFQADGLGLLRDISQGIAIPA